MEGLSLADLDAPAKVICHELVSASQHRVAKGTDTAVSEKSARWSVWPL